jgi:GNAT superfamily N-acetyltransferase
MDDQFTIRRATPDDVPALTEQRRLMFETMGHTDPAQLAAMSAAFEGWVRERLARERYLAWLAINADGQAAAGAGLMLREHPPRPDDLSGQRGYLLNVYTYPAYRRRGLAERLVRTAIHWCRAQGIYSLTLNATEAGRGIYARLGFEDSDEMTLWAGVEES